MIFEIKYCIYCIMCNVESVIQVIVCNILNSKCVKFFFQNCTQQTDVRCKDIFPECFSPVSSCIQPVHSHHFCTQPVHSHHFCDSDFTCFLSYVAFFCLTVYLLYNVQCGKCNTSNNINICFLFNFPTKISCNDITKITH